MPRLLSDANSKQIPNSKLRIILDVIEARHQAIEKKWLDTFGEIKYYC